MISKEWKTLLPEIQKWLQEKESNYYKCTEKYIMYIPFFAEKTYQEFSIFQGGFLLVTLYRKEQGDIEIETKYYSIKDDIEKLYNRMKKNKLE